nr:hypothetical protein [Tanacetum cinerariifolium]
MVKLDHICRDTNDMLIFARSYGLSGFVRSSMKVDQWFEFDDERMNIDRKTYQSVKEGGQSVSINGHEVGHVNDEDALMNVATSWPLSIAIDARETVKYDENLVDQKFNLHDQSAEVEIESTDIVSDVGLLMTCC